VHLHEGASFRGLGELLDHCLKFYDTIRDSDEKADMVNAMSSTIGRHGNGRTMRRLSNASIIPSDIGHTALTEAIHGTFRSRATLANRVLLLESGDFHRQLSGIEVAVTPGSMYWQEGFGKLLETYRLLQAKNRRLEQAGHPDKATASLLATQIDKLETIEREASQQPPIMANMGQLWDIFRDARQVFQRVGTDARPKEGTLQSYNELAKTIGTAMEPLYDNLMRGLERISELNLSLKHGAQTIHIQIPNDISNPIHSEHNYAQVLIGLLSGRGLLDVKKLPPNVAAQMQAMGQTTVIVEQWESLIRVIRHALEQQGVKGEALQSILAQNGLGASRDDMEVIRKACRNSAQEMAFLERFGLTALQNNEIQRHFHDAVQEVRAYAGIADNEADSLASTRAQVAFLCRVIFNKSRKLAKDTDAAPGQEGVDRTTRVSRELEALNDYYVRFTEEVGANRPGTVMIDRPEKPWLVSQEEMPVMQAAITAAYAAADELAQVPDKTGIGCARRAGDLRGIIALLEESVTANRNLAHERQARGTAVA